MVNQRGRKSAGRRNRLQVMVDDSLYDAVKDSATEEGLTVSTYLEKLVREATGVQQ